MSNKKHQTYARVTRSQIAVAPSHTFQGTLQGRPSVVPPRTRAAYDDRLRIQPSYRDVEYITEDTRPRMVWKRYVFLGLVACAALLYAMFTYVVPAINTTINQWHYGDARVSYTTLPIDGVYRDVLGVGYKGVIEVIVLPNQADPQSHSSAYILPAPDGDKSSRVVSIQAVHIDGDLHTDLALTIEGAGSLVPILYGKGDGTFTWTHP